MKRILGWKPNLLTTFSLLGGFITIIIAIIFALGLEYYLEQNALQQEANIAAYQVTILVSPNLSRADLSAPFASTRLVQINSLINKDNLPGHIVRIKIWNKSGMLLYSDEISLIGKTFPVSDELEKGIKGEIAKDVSSLNDLENVAEKGSYNRLLEVYVPIRLNGSNEVVGVYEIYSDLSVLDQDIVAMQRFVWLSVGFGFLILYGSLFILVRNASHELVRQNEENNLLYVQEQTRLGELSALYDLSRALADAIDCDTIFTLVTRHAVETVEVTFSRVALLEGNEFVIKAAYPIRILEHSLKVSERDTLSSNQTFHQILEQNTFAVISDDSSNLSDDERETLFLGMAKTICLMPLRTGNRVFGLLILGEARSKEREPFSQDKIRLCRSIGDQAASALYRVELFKHLEESFLKTVLSLANAVEAKDTYTADHSQFLAEMALAIGHDMGMTEKDLRSLHYGALLHDIGKIGVPDAVLQKPARLDPDEWAQMREHPSIGARILAPVPQLADAAQIVRHHHERYDGKGYPDELKGESIPLGARILAVVDTYSAITDKRVYKNARSHTSALIEIERNAGTQFDPCVVKLFLENNNEARMKSL
ncbi:MAG: HD domain-containing protein [Chloroflexi bacterium]|nr:HD domain-containing protein [Chloroflexota bacterium]